MILWQASDMRAEANEVFFADDGLASDPHVGIDGSIVADSNAGFDDGEGADGNIFPDIGFRADDR